MLFSCFDETSHVLRVWSYYLSTPINRDPCGQAFYVSVCPMATFLRFIAASKGYLCLVYAHNRCNGKSYPIVISVFCPTSRASFTRRVEGVCLYNFNAYPFCFVCKHRENWIAKRPIMPLQACGFLTYRQHLATQFQFDSHR